MPDIDSTSFQALDLRPELQENLARLGFSEMTPIQASSLPSILEGKDVIGQAKTGSGKTAAFALGILQKLEVKKFRVQCLVLCPTRELADQVAGEIRTLGRAVHNIKVLSLCGGVPFGPQLGSLEHGAHIIVGTPGRIEEHLRKRSLDLANLTMFVLDEADRMLDMGFQPVLDKIAGHVPAHRQTLLFSATFPDKIEQLSARLMNQPKRITAADTLDTSQIVQQLYRVSDNSSRLQALKLLLLNYKPESALVFCNTKQLVEEVTTELKSAGFYAAALHGDLEQRERDRRLLMFSNKSLSILVATDVAARGLDIDALELVVNYHLSRDIEVHTHRIGRTGRAGAVGLACSLYNDKEAYKLTALDEALGYQVPRVPLPPASLLKEAPAAPNMITLQLDGGKKQKVRKGDILGALTGQNGISGSAVGKITVSDNAACVAVERSVSKQALKILGDGKVKGRSFRVRRLR